MLGRLRAGVTKAGLGYPLMAASGADFFLALLAQIKPVAVFAQEAIRRLGHAAFVAALVTLVNNCHSLVFPHYSDNPKRLDPHSQLPALVVVNVKRHTTGF